jgi:hypothetical protein
LIAPTTEKPGPDSSTPAGSQFFADANPTAVRDGG